MEAVISNTNYHSTPGLSIQFFILVLLSLSLMLFDYRDSVSMAPVRTFFAIVAYPIKWVVDVPYRTYNETAAFLKNQTDLMVENNKLRDYLRIYEARSQDMAVVEAQNERLRTELKANKREGYEFSMAEVLSASNDRVRHVVTINKGTRDGVFEKQVVLSGGSIYGQVLSVTPFSAEVIQLIDRRHAIPVRNQRTQFPALALGAGKSNILTLDNVVLSNDMIKEGDVFVSSGLDHLFPADFPVAKVVVGGIQYGQGDQFAQIKTQTAVSFEQTREVLLLWPKRRLTADDAGQKEPESVSAAPTNTAAGVNPAAPVPIVSKPPLVSAPNALTQTAKPATPAVRNQHSNNKPRHSAQKPVGAAGR